MTILKSPALLNFSRPCHLYLHSYLALLPYYFNVSRVWEKIICVVNTSIDIKEEEEARTTVFLTPAFNGIFENTGFKY